MKISIDKISHSAPIIWNIMEVVSWLCVISRLQKLLFSYLKTTLWRGADSCRDALVDNSCSLDGNSIPTNVTSSWLLSLRHSAPPRALRVELMSLISEVCSVVREAKNSPGSSSFCAAERLTFRCRPPLTWMEVKKHLTAQLCETFARNGSNSESFCTGAVSVSIKPRSPLVFRRRLEALLCWLSAASAAVSDWTQPTTNKVKCSGWRLWERLPVVCLLDHSHNPNLHIHLTTLDEITVCGFTPRLRRGGVCNARNRKATVTRSEITPHPHMSI